MRVRINRILTGVAVPLIGMLLAGTTVLAQTPTQRPDHWPDAAGVVELALAGAHSLAVTTAFYACPSENPYGDTVWVAMLERAGNPELSDRLALAWARALVACNDPRIESWYHARVLEATAASVLTALFPLLRHDTPTNIEFLKRIANDESRDDEIRGFVLHGLGGTELDRRTEVYLGAAARTERLPQPCGDVEWFALAVSAVGEDFVDRTLQFVVRQPGTIAATFLVRLAGLERVMESAALRARLDVVSRRILAEPPGRYPEELVDAAGYAQESLERRQHREPDRSLIKTLHPLSRRTVTQRNALGADR